MRKSCLLLAAAVLCALATDANAAVVVQTFNITASGFEAGAPAEPVTGSFTFSYDDAAFQFAPTSVGLTISGLNIAYNGTAMFTYSPSAGGLLTVGNNVGFNSYTVGPAVPGFGFFLSNPGTAPALSSFTYSANGHVWNASHIEVTEGAVPEPATWAMLLVGFGLIGTVLRARRRRVFAPRLA